MLRTAFSLSPAWPKADIDFNQPQFATMKVAHRSDWKPLLIFNGLAGRPGPSFSCGLDFRLIFIVSRGQFSSIPIPDSSLISYIPLTIYLVLCYAHSSRMRKGELDKISHIYS